MTRDDVLCAGMLAIWCSKETNLDSGVSLVEPMALVIVNFERTRKMGYVLPARQPYCSKNV